MASPKAHMIISVITHKNPYNPGTALYAGYDELSKLDGRTYQEFRDTVGPRRDPDNRPFSPSTVLRRAKKDRHVVLIEPTAAPRASQQETRLQVENSIAQNEISEEKKLWQRDDIPQTQKEQLIKARLGQGIFRERVAYFERGCRLTDVTVPSHLRASHIKPWRDSSDEERLDGNNGLLLSPHIDHLFDRGYISFEDDGTLLLSEQASTETLERWNVPRSGRFGSFRPEQILYLDYHRNTIFLR